MTTPAVIWLTVVFVFHIGFFGWTLYQAIREGKLHAGEAR